MKSLRRSLAVALAVAAAIALAPASASAGDTYLVLKGGVWAPTASDGFSTASSLPGVVAAGQFPASGDIEIAYGAKLGIIGAQISAGYMWTSQVVTDPGGLGSATVKAGGIPFSAVGQLRLPIFFIQPYLELGIGGFVNFASATGAADTLSATKVSFMAIGGAGVDFILGPILLGAEARYNYITEQAFDWGTMRLSGVTITANVGYIF
jgi:hypothetical protein